MKAKAFIAVIVTLIFAGCSPSTYITGSWKNPAATAKYKNIMVAALTANTIAKATLEENVARTLGKNVNVSKSIDEFPPGLNNKDSSKATIMRKVKNKNVDALLTISILSRETESRYMRSSSPYSPAGYVYYNDLWGYYDHWYPSVYNDGYYVNDKVYFIETNLYDTETKKLIWSAQSKTYSPDNLEPFAKEFATVTVSKMKEDGVFNAEQKNTNTNNSKN